MKNEKNKEFKKRLYKLVLRTIKLVETSKKTQTTKIVGEQLIRSITSVLANYIEGYAASSKKDYSNYFRHSLKSANESKVWVSLLKDIKSADEQECREILAELEEVSRIFGSSILTLKGEKRNV